MDKSIVSPFLTHSVKGGSTVDFFITEPNKVNNMVWKLFQQLLAAY